MSLRTKLFLAQVPLALALVLVGSFSVATTSMLGRRIQDVLRMNYRSVLAAQRMKEAVERLDRVALYGLAGHGESASDEVRSQRQLFSDELAVEESNITEPGEKEAAQRLRASWEAYDQALRGFLSGSPVSREYFRLLAPRFQAVKLAAQEILDINQDAMVRQSRRAQEAAERANSWMSLGALAALLLGTAGARLLTGRMLRPLDGLSQAAQRIGEGDLEARARVVGGDEIAALAREFNEMADRLAQYRIGAMGQLLQAQETSRAAMDSIPYPVLVLGVDGSLLNVNEAGLELLRLKDRSQGLGAIEGYLREIIEAARAHVLAGKGPYVPRGFEEAVAVSAPGGPRYLLARATPIYASGGAVSGVTIVLQDVTRLRRFDELRNDLVATVAHEFRTPLTSLHMAIHLCLQEAAGPVTEKQADLLHAARQDCERLQGIIDDLLDLARLQAGKEELERRAVSPRTLVEDAVAAHRALAEQQGVTLEEEAVTVLDDVAADADSIHRVFSNLVANALRHTPSGGVVTVGLAEEPGAVKFFVTDTGPGIAREHLDRLFDRFYRIPGSPLGGAGLGLAIAKEIVIRHGGQIGVESEPGKGATFWFKLRAVGREA
ncbi:MAG: HAMP domain-containing protein [Candidatus Wallbacteria bacterium]|nr:HAMP domain-containing protein [Candidatus Wallbacteria bacterium]